MYDLARKKSQTRGKIQARSWMLEETKIGWVKTSYPTKPHVRDQNQAENKDRGRNHHVY